MKKHLIAVAVLAVLLIAAPVYAETRVTPKAELYTNPTTGLIADLVARLEIVEADSERIDALEDTVARLNCLAAELTNPEPEHYHNGLRVYASLETSKACWAYRNPPGHLYETPEGHLNPSGHEHYTNSPAHTHEDPHEEEEAPILVE